MRLPLALTLVALLVAGCTTSPSATTGTDGAAPAVDDATAAAPKVDAAETLATLKTFAEAHPYRQSGTAMHQAARDELAGAMEAAGLDVMRQTFDVQSGGVLPVSYQGENIIGIKWGEDREHWVVVGAHYDVTEGAVFGTYDDGSGTILTLKLAEAFANVPTNRTIAFIEFDEEELGLVGSGFFVQSVVDGTFEHAVTVDAMIDLDMVGITYPHPAKLVCWQNSPPLQEKIEELRAAVGVPDGQVEYRKPLGGSSDGASFIRADMPTAYFWSDWDEVVTPQGQVVPFASYPFWHQADTYEGMVALAGDEATLTAGFQTVLDIVSPLLAYAASAEYVPAVEAQADE